MPTIASSNIPAPNGWDEFEDIVLSASKLRWESSDFYRNGRQGQKQNGVDIYGHDDSGSHIGLQCKNSVAGISLSIVETEVENAESFYPKIDRLYIVTTSSRDATLQKEVRDLSGKRKAVGLSPVNILFWEDVCHELSKDDTIFFQHYPQFRPSKATPSKEHDLGLLNELTTLLNSKGVIGFLDRTNMAGFPFREIELDPLRQFCFEWNKPEKEFISKGLESIRKDLWEKVDAYYDLYAHETFPTNSPGFQSVPKEWESEQRDRFSKVVSGLHKLAGEM